MPRRPSRPCRQCREPHRNANGYCDNHQDIPEGKERERKARFDKQRPSAAKRGYDSKWQKASRGYLAKHPLCVEHERRGYLVPATVVDHIIPHRGDKQLFWDRSNWQGLCKTCHDRKTATEDSTFANRSRG